MMRISHFNRYGLALIVFLISVNRLCGLLAAEEPPITDLAFSPDGTMVVAVSQSGVTLYGWPDLLPVRTISTAMPNLHSIGFSPGGEQLAVAGGFPSEKGIVEVFAWPGGERIRTIEAHDDSIRSIAWLNADQFVTASLDRDMRCWSVESGDCLYVLKGHSRSVDALCVVDDARASTPLLVSTGTDQSVRVWSLESKQLIRSMNQHTRPVHAISPRPLQSGLPMVATAADDRTIRFWQPTIGRLVRYIRLDSEPLDIAWTQSGNRILAACQDGRVRVIDPLTVEVQEEFAVVDGWAYAIAIQPGQPSGDSSNETMDRTRIVVGGSNGQIKMLELGR